MPLKSFFPEQLKEIKDFFTAAKEVVRLVTIDPEMKPMLFKALAKMEDDAEFPHALLQYNNEFIATIPYFQDLHALIKKEYQDNREALIKEGVDFTLPYSQDSDLKAPAKFIRYTCALAESLPEHLGSIILILDPENMENSENYKKSIAYLAAKTTSRWVKFLVLDSRLEPVLKGLEKNHKKIGQQTFYLAPEEIERRAKQDLKSPGALSPLERRQYVGLLAGFAYAKKDYDQAANLQTRWVKAAEKEGEPGETATAYYNLGNTLAEKQDYGAAINAYCKASDLCNEHKLEALAPYVYTNLGIALHREGSFKQAFASLKVARDMFKAQNHRPGEAHVVDCLAQMYAMDKENEKAEKSWLYALSIYDGITASTFKDLRESGREDIVAKLERFYDDTGQSAKKNTIPQKA